MKKNAFLLATLFSTIPFFLSGQISLPYYNDFETDTSGWYSSGIANYYFEWDTSGGLGCIGTKGMQTNYNTNGGLSILHSPVFNFSGISSASICLTHQLTADNGLDGIRIEYSYDGNVWQVLGNAQTGTNWYNANFLQSSGLPGWTASISCSASFITLDNLLPANTIQFRFVPTATNTPFNYFLDDFKICTPGCTCNTTVDIAEQLTEPNPILTQDLDQHNITVYFDNPETEGISIINLQGKSIEQATTTPSGHRFTSRALTIGVYLVKIRTRNQVIVKKVVVF